MKKTVKAWAVLYGKEVVAVFADKVVALEKCTDVENSIVRCTITYQLPTIKSKK